jgi:hypothetical protein
MKKTVQIVEVEDEGFLALMNEVITIFSLNYIYTGKLIGVNDTCVLLENPAIVYETGDFYTDKWKNHQKLPNNLYVQTNCIESFGIVK